MFTGALTNLRRRLGLCLVVYGMKRIFAASNYVAPALNRIVHEIIFLSRAVYYLWLVGCDQNTLHKKHRALFSVSCVPLR